MKSRPLITRSLRATSALLASIPLLAASSASALTLDFEESNPFSGGVLSDAQAFSGSKSLLVGAGDRLTYNIPVELQGKDIVVSMQVYDMGKWVDLEVPDAPANVYGPRWGVSAGTHTGPESLGAGILLRTFSHGATFQSYGLQQGDGRFDSWFSPAGYSGANRDHFFVEGTGGSNGNDGWIPGEGAGGEWTTWTFRISADGATTSIQFNDLTPMTSAAVAKNIGGSPTQIWLYGGSGATLSGMYVDDVKIIEERFVRISEIEAENIPEIDGDLDDIYRGDPPNAIATVGGGTAANDETDFSANWYGVWDSERFYLFIDITDEHLEDTAGTDTWRNDIVEIYFNMDNFRDPAGNAQTGDNYQYAFHWNKPEEGYVSGQGSLEGVQWAQKTTDKGWTVEVSFPWTSLTERTMDFGVDFGFDIAVNDNDGNPTYDSVHYWSSNKALWGNLATAGTVELGFLFDGNYLPEIAPLGVQEATEGVESVITITATDNNSDDTLTFTSSDLPSFATLTDNEDRTASITVNAADGDTGIYTFNVSVTDGSFSDSIKVTLIVRDDANPSQAPVFDAVDDVVIDRGASNVVSLIITDLDSLTVTLEATDLPAFATFKDNGDKTGTVTISPTPDVEPGDYNVTIVATDDEDNVATTTFKVTVTNVVPRTTFYLDPENGSLENDGSPENPWPSLEAVMAAGKVFAAGDTLYLLDGYHGEPDLKGANTGYVYVTAAEDAEPQLSRLIISGDYWHVTGLTISREFAPVFSRTNMVGVNGKYNYLGDSEIFTAADVSEWTEADWNDRSSNGVNLNGSNNTLEYCTILNTNFSVQMGADSSFNVARGNHIQWFSGDGIRVNGGDQLAEYNYIADCVNVNDNHDDGIQAWSTGSAGTGSGTVERVTLRGNVIVETTDPDRKFNGPLQGIGLFDGMFVDFLIENNVVLVHQWHGIALLGAINCKVINNTVIDQNFDGGAPRAWITIQPHKNYNATGNTEEQNTYYRGRDNVVRNNITGDIYRDLANNDGWAVVENNVEIGPNDLDDYFVAYPFDLRLKRGAPAINAGSSVDAPAVDADGVARPQGSAVDLGAYEWFGSWLGFDMDGEWVSTGPYLGTVFVQFEPWVFQQETSLWYFVDPDSASPLGAWVFSPDLIELGTPDENGWTDSPIGWAYASDAPWIYLAQFNAWAYIVQDAVTGEGAWIYIVSSLPPLG